MWFFSVASAFDPATPGPAVSWPDRDDPGPVDTVVTVYQAVSGELGELVLLDSDGVEVPTERHDLTSLDGVDWAVLDPIETLNAGEYTIGGQIVRLGGSLAEPGAAPRPVVRLVHSEVNVEGEVSSHVQYRLCDPQALVLLALGDEEPPIPTLSETGPVQLGGPEWIQLTDGLSAGMSTTIWLGGFDATGRFTGWTADPLVMPPAGTVTAERIEGATSGTPDAFADCPAGDWALESSETCEQWTASMECRPSCGCAMGPSPGWGWLLSLLLWRRGRSTRSSASCSTNPDAPLWLGLFRVCRRRPSGRPWRSPARV